jgi:hypothetical protein
MIQMEELDLSYNNIIQGTTLLENNNIIDEGIKNIIQMQNLCLLGNIKITDK